MKECLVCCSQYNNNEFTLPCGCEICQNCSFDWIASENSSTLHVEQEFFHCPNFKCKKDISIDFIYANFSKEHLNTLDHLLFQKYLNHNPEIRKCPKSTCSYAGFIGQENGNNNNDNSSVCCDLCKAQWKSSLLLSKFKVGWCNIQWFFEELSELRIRFFYRPCYHCKKNIYKYEGCNHITCVCKREFCYSCLDNWSNHNYTKCCDKSDITGIGIFVYLILLFLKLMTSFALTQLAGEYFIFFAFLQITAIAIFIGSGLIILFGLKVSLFDNFHLLFSMVLLILFGFYCCGHGYFIYYLYNAYYYFRISFYIGLIESIAVGAFLLCSFVIRTCICPRRMRYY